MGALGEKRRLECERVVRQVESQVERFMVIEDGEKPYEFDGVMSILLGTIDGKGAQIEIHVQPGNDDDYWRT